MVYNRIELFDGMRGFALLGILLVHITAFQHSFGYEPNEDAPLIDIITIRFVQIVAEGSFISLFALMFGIGVMLLKRSLEKKGINPYPIFSRRFLFLFGVGIVHGVVLWEGDILLSYSLAAIFLLLFFMRCKPITCLIWGITLMIGPPFISIPLRFFGHIESSYINAMDIVYLFLPYSKFVILLDYFYHWADALPIFLIGMYLFQTTLFTNARSKQKRNRNISLALLVLGFTLKALHYVAKYPIGEDMLVISQFLVTLGYVYGITFLYTTVVGKRLFLPFEYIGKMSMTNYVAHTVTFTLIFIPAGYLFEGIGLIEKIHISYGPIVAVVTIFLQVLISKWWLSKFTAGPIEWVWRLWTYWKWTPITKRDLSQVVNS
ncbi:DUF418 domain-containing protein [Paenibacillus sp. GSMTC-2017]|uniref:DUF418 domain-containing protein n=1 Tax=Paenibacillus sp. GSMTC-2017 TaxID=2794350 RepID=UPI0018D6ECEE|nr:DUF418 domain-containing protein [Paenibacillus sp. GSMTC-2017]MBH5317623.1 DUF418 domain-containing protein [Paenibacillus sp. GSMTC-2017]